MYIYTYIYSECPRRKFQEILQDEIVFSLICMYVYVYIYIYIYIQVSQKEVPRDIAR